MAYQEEGFERVDAVLTDEQNLFLIQGQEFIQYNQDKDTWSYAKPLARVWRGLEFNETNFSTVVTAFQGSDGKVTFFSSDSFAVTSHDLDHPAPSHTPSPILKIRDHWGLVDNAFTRRGVVDAAFVWDERETYLFSGAQYVKYSDRDYRFVDEGYPKRIAESLRSEAIFHHLPESFELEMKTLAEHDQGLRAVVANQGTIYLWIGQTLHTVSSQTYRTYSVAALGQVKNRIMERQRIDAALVNRKDQVLLFAGDQVFKYSEHTFESVDEGYPQKISDLLAREEGF